MRKASRPALAGMACVFGFVMWAAGAARGDDWPMFMHDAAHTGVSAERLKGKPRLLWELPLGRSSAAPVAAAGAVYAGNWAGEFFAVDIDGKLKWKVSTAGPVCYAAAVSGKLVCVGSADGVFYAFNTENGREAWRVLTGDQIWTSPIIVDGTVYFGSNDGNCYAVELASGKLVWQKALDSRMHGSPASDGERIFALSHAGVLYALSRKDGSELWRNDLGAEIFNASPSVRGGVVYVALSSRRLNEDGVGYEPSAAYLADALKALRAEDGGVIWQRGYVPPAKDIYDQLRDGLRPRPQIERESSFYWATPTVSDDMLFVQGTERTGYDNFWNNETVAHFRWVHFYILDRRTGEPRFKRDNYFQLHGRMMNPTGGWCAAALAGNSLVGSGGVIDVRDCKYLGPLGEPPKSHGNSITTAAAISGGRIYTVRMGWAPHALAAFEMEVE